MKMFGVGAFRRMFHQVWDPSPARPGGGHWDPRVVALGRVFGDGSPVVGKYAGDDLAGIKFGFRQTGL